MTATPENALAELARVARLDPAGRPAALEPLLRHPSPLVREPALRVGAAVLPLDRLVAYLRDGSDAVLRNAGLEMLKARGAEMVSIGIGLLQDHDSDVVLQAVLLLDHLRAPRALEALRRSLGHPNPNVVQAVIVAIGHLGSAGAVADLVPFLDADLWLRLAAVQALGDLRSGDAVSPLARLLTDDTVGSVAAESLARIGGGAAFTHLAAHWLREQDSSDSLLGLLLHVAEESAERLPAVEGLQEALNAVLVGARSGSRPEAARCLLTLGPSTGDTEALTALGAAGIEQGALPVCLRRRHDLIGSLLRGKGPSREWGLRLAARHPDHTPPSALATVLAEATGVEHFDALTEALFVADPSRMGPALVSLYARLPREARLRWTPVLEQHRTAIRRALTGGVALPDHIRSILAIVAEPAPEHAAMMLRTTSPDARAEALTHVLKRPDVLRLLPWTQWLEEAPDRYGALAVAVADRGALAGQIEAVRRIARQQPHKELIRLLGRLRDRESASFLAELVEQRAEGLVPFAIAALGNIGGMEARRALREVASADTPWARFAFRALADCHTPDDLPFFRTAAGHADWHVRMVSAEVLGRVRLSADLATLLLLAADPMPAVAERAQRVLNA
jgi:HEAT repeat protein